MLKTLSTIGHYPYPSLSYSKPVSSLCLWVLPCIFWLLHYPPTVHVQCPCRGTVFPPGSVSAFPRYLFLPRSPRILGITNVELLVRVTLYAIPQLQHLPSSILPVQTLVVPDKLVRKCILNMPLLAEEGHTRIGSGPGRVENHDGTRFRLPGAFGPVWR